MASGYPILVGGITILTSEALYQALRFPHLPQIQEEIIACKSPMGAKMIAKKHKSRTRDDWEKVKIDLMYLSILLKTAQNFQKMKALFLQTGCSPIVEDSWKNRFWGAVMDRNGSCLKGYNVLGKLLEIVRSPVAKESGPEKLTFNLPSVEYTAICGAKLTD